MQSNFYCPPFEFDSNLFLSFLGILLWFLIFNRCKKLSFCGSKLLKMWAGIPPYFHNIVHVAKLCIDVGLWHVLTTVVFCSKMENGCNGLTSFREHKIDEACCSFAFKTSEVNMFRSISVFRCHITDPHVFDCVNVSPTNRQLHMELGSWWHCRLAKQFVSLKSS